MGLTGTVAESLTKAFTQNTTYVATAQVWQSIHSANPAGTGANEITAGTGAAGRQLVTFSGASGTDTNTSLEQYVFGIGVGAVCTWVGYWTAQTGGTFLAGFPLVGPPIPSVLVGGLAAVFAPSHGLVLGQPVRLFTTPGQPASAVPSGFTADTVYYVNLVASVDTLTLAATSGGATLTPSSSGGFSMCPDLSQSFPTGGQLVFPASTGITWATSS